MDLPLDVRRMRHVFDGTVLPIHFQWLRTPVPDGLFRLTGQALRLTRQEHLACTAETVVIADPPNWQRATARGMGLHFMGLRPFRRGPCTCVCR
jgi:hypothetical protein